MRDRLKLGPIPQRDSTREAWLGTGVDGHGIISVDTEISVSLDESSKFMHYKSLRIDAGATLRTSNRCGPLVILVQGDCIINGTLSMAGKGGTLNPGGYYYLGLYATPKFEFYQTGGYPADYAINCCSSGAIGGTGGAIQTKGTNGISADYPTNLCGGGGGGGGSQNATGGSGSAGTALRGGAGGGGAKYSVVGSAASNRTGGNGAGSLGGGGAGDPPGTGYEPGETGIGGVIILVVGGNLIIGATGVISADGMDGGDGVTGGTPTQLSGGGGGSGGGAVLIRYLGTCVNNGSITANGGIGGAGGSGWDGGDGGAGTVSIAQLT